VFEAEKSPAQVLETIFLSSGSPAICVQPPVQLPIVHQRMLAIIFDKRKVSPLDIDFFDMRRSCTGSQSPSKKKSGAKAHEAEQKTSLL
jgi:hypothetical protein